MTGNRPQHPRAVAVDQRPASLPDVGERRARSVWYDCRRIDTREDPTLLAARNAGIDTLLVNRDRLHEFQDIASRVQLVAYVDGPGGLDGVPAHCVVASEREDLLDAAAQTGHGTALLATISDAETLQGTLAAAPRFDYLIAKLLDPTNIPLEMVIARLRDRGTALMKQVVSAEEAAIAFETLEMGSDGVLLTTENIGEFSRLQAERRKYERGRLELVRASLVRTQYIGMGHRACVDTISMMTNRDAFVVGSTSTGGLLACSETHPLPYMNLRPFRVNAGAVHSYIWGPENMVEYLADLKVGSRVLGVDTSGETRVLVVGRVKIEVRPLMLVEARYDGVLINAIVQDDWHIRLFRGDGEAASVTTLKPGDQLLAHITEPGRHVGIFLKETIIER